MTPADPEDIARSLPASSTTGAAKTKFATVHAEGRGLIDLDRRIADAVAVDMPLDQVVARQQHRRLDRVRLFAASLRPAA